MSSYTDAPAGPDPATNRGRDRLFFAVNAVVSVAALAFLAWLLALRGKTGGADDLAFMPAVNASLNAVSATCLVLAVRAIKKKDVAKHRALVIAAFVASALFLVCYIVYHYAHGDTVYPKGNALRPLYLVVLASHIILSAVVVPGVLTAFYLAFSKRFAAHKKVTRITFPIWLYVSVTGVVIFVMLRAALGG